MKRLEFEKLRFKNILSYGNVITEFDFNSTKKQSIGVIGDIGCGKSSLFEIIFYAMFGKPYRNINQTSLINRENNSNCWVEFTFKSNDDSYVITRGMKPTVFTIHKNGKESDLTSHPRDIQKYVENNIIGISEEVFGQMFMIGLGNFKSFFELKLEEKREILEYILSINVLSTMNEKVKKIQKNLDSEIKTIKTDLDNAVEKKKIYKQKIEDIEKLQNNIDYSKDIAEYEAKIKNLDSIIDSIDIDDLEEKAEELEKKLEKIEKDKRSNEKLVNENKVLMKEKQKVIDFLKKNDVCPVCTQAIDLEFKKKIITESEVETKKYDIDVKKYEKILKELDKSYTDLDDKNDDIEAKIKKSKDASKTKEMYKKNLDDFNKKQKKGNTDSKKILDDINIELKKLTDEMKENKAQGNKIANQLELNKHTLYILSDAGFKKYLYEFVLKKINRYTNQNLFKFDMNVKFKIKNDLKTDLYYKDGESLDFFSFSNGEKMLIIFSLFFAFQQFTEEFYGFHCNYLFFDEILDVSINSKKSGYITNYLNEIDKNILIITHNPLYDFFDKIFTVEKDSLGFSFITEVQFDTNKGA